jgi:NAD(P) transhydrogenase
MIRGAKQWDLIVIGAGPAGQKAAIQGAKLGKRVLVIEQEASVGGYCVRRGTIPSKTLREAGLALSTLRRRCGQSFDVEEREEVALGPLLERVERVIEAHEGFMAGQLARNDVEVWHGRARFADPHTLTVEAPSRGIRLARGGVIVIATGSRPRAPTDVPIDHENIFDSDSILSMTYLPRSLTVLGAGVIACEYACIFQSLGTKVLVVDQGPAPMSFLDAEISQRFLQGFERMGGRFLGRQRVRAVEWDGFASVSTTLESGVTVQSEKLLCARGRVANLEGLQLDRAGLEPNAQGVLPVDAHFKTDVPHIYAVGDVAGPPALASTAMDQGRRAVAHAFGLDPGAPMETVPSGIYTVPEIGTVGLTEEQAIERYGGAVVGRSSFDEVARGQIMGVDDGLLKLVADPSGQWVLGVQIVGEGAAELVHLGQMAIIAKLPVEAFIQNIFNFPTLAEAYRIAALDIAKQRMALGRSHSDAVTRRPRASCA